MMRSGVRCRDGGVKGGEVPQGGSSVHICNEKIVIYVPAKCSVSMKR